MQGLWRGLSDIALLPRAASPWLSWVLCLSPHCSILQKALPYVICLCLTHEANKKQPPRHHGFRASHSDSQDSSPGTPKLQGMHGKGAELVSALSHLGMSPSAEMPAGCRSSAVKPTDATKAGFIQGQDLLPDHCPNESANLIQHTSIIGKKGTKSGARRIRRPRNGGEKICGGTAQWDSTLVVLSKLWEERRIWSFLFASVAKCNSICNMADLENKWSTNCKWICNKHINTYILVHDVGFHVKNQKPLFPVIS